MHQMKVSVEVLQMRVHASDEGISGGPSDEGPSDEGISGGPLDEGPCIR